MSSYPSSYLIILKEFFTTSTSSLFIILYSFVKALILMLLLTIIIATITLLERKLLSLVQRRVGPNYIGYKGRLQFIADALKLLVKHIHVLTKTNRLQFLTIPAGLLITSYLFWINLVWAPHIAVCEIEYNLLIMGILSLVFSILFVAFGWVSNNKYAILASNRTIIAALNLEILLNFLIITLLALYNSFSFVQISAMQAQHWAIAIYLPILPIVLITFLLETARIPFDLVEAESELIAGLTTELGGFFFALVYLGEYIHLFSFSVIITLCLLGGSW